MICIFCKINFPKDFTYCMECGSVLEEDKGQLQAFKTEKKTQDIVSKCPTCGSELFEGDTFCGSCGTKLMVKSFVEEQQEEKIFCKQCNAMNSKDDAFCSNCGAEIRQDYAEALVGLGVSESISEPKDSEVFNLEAKGVDESSFVQEEKAIDSKFCFQCGADLEPGSQFCGFCGAVIGKDIKTPEPTGEVPSQIAASELCQVCGMENEAGSDFCGTCGSPIKSLSKEPEKEISKEIEKDKEQETVNLGIKTKEEVEIKEGDENFIICKLCGEKSPSDSKFCSNCGIDF